MKIGRGRRKSCPVLLSLGHWARRRRGTGWVMESEIIMMNDGGRRRLPWLLMMEEDKVLSEEGNCSVLRLLWVMNDEEEEERGWRGLVTCRRRALLK